MSLITLDLFIRDINYWFARQIHLKVEAMRPEPAIRDELDIGYTRENSRLEIFEIRPRWRDPSKIYHSPIAKATFVKSKSIWKLYWMRASMKWVSYQPHPECNTVDEVFAVIKEDAKGCFFG